MFRQSSGYYKTKMIEGYKHVGIICHNNSMMHARLGLENEAMIQVECLFGL